MLCSYRELALCYFFEVMGPDSSFFFTLFSRYWCSLWLKSVNLVNRNVVQVSKNPQSHAFQASRCLYVSSLSFFFFFMQDYDDLCGKSSIMISIGFLQNSWLLSTDFCKEEKKGSSRVCGIHKPWGQAQQSSSLIQSQHPAPTSRASSNPPAMTDSMNATIIIPIPTIFESHKGVRSKKKTKKKNGINPNQIWSPSRIIHQQISHLQAYHVGSWNCCSKSCNSQPMITIGIGISISQSVSQKMLNNKKHGHCKPCRESHWVEPIFLVSLELLSPKCRALLHVIQPCQDSTIIGLNSKKDVEELHVHSWMYGWMMTLWSGKRRNPGATYLSPVENHCRAMLLGVQTAFDPLWT